MDQLQQKEIEMRETDRKQSNRITAINTAMSIHPGMHVTDMVIDEAKKILAFIEGIS